MDGSLVVSNHFLSKELESSSKLIANHQFYWIFDVPGIWYTCVRIILPKIGRMLQEVTDKMPVNPLIPPNLQAKLYAGYRVQLFKQVELCSSKSDLISQKVNRTCRSETQLCNCKMIYNRLVCFSSCLLRNLTEKQSNWGSKGDLIRQCHCV